MASNHKLVCARAARLQFAGAYQQAVKDYRFAKLSALTLARGLEEKLPNGLALLPLAFLYDGEVAQLSWEGAVLRANAGARARPAHFRVMARTRPLQPQELEEKRYESVSSECGNHAVVVHDGRVHRDGRTIYSVHSRFCLDAVFSERADNLEVFQEAVEPLLASALEGGRATVVFFGQTGTGKTYTARGALDLMSERVFRKARQVEMCCYEMAGTRGGREAFFDLLAGAERKQVKCLTGEDGNVHVRGARKLVCQNAAELREAMDQAFAWRSSECTERNEASSRSHCVLEFQFAGAPEENEESSAGESLGGLFRVVDLAGSERNFETQMHSRSMAERGGLINYSLLMLKECARVMHNNQAKVSREEMHVPFRSSRLTHLLKSSFVDEGHLTTVVATLSPSPTDVEHSLNTLQHVGMMRSARSWESPGPKDVGPVGPKEKGEANLKGFDVVQGRGHALHSKLQDARKGQLELHAFQMKTAVGGSLMKKYEAQNSKTETFIDARWHRELNVKVQEDLWVLREADAEATQILDDWREKQWAASKAHDLSRWSCQTLQGFLKSLDLPGEVKIPSTMTGAQLRRLGRRGLASLCSDAATAEALHQALTGETEAGKAAAAAHRTTNARLTALGNHKVHVALEVGAPAALAAPASLPQEPASEDAQHEPASASDASAASAAAGGADAPTAAAP